MLKLGKAIPKIFKLFTLFWLYTIYSEFSIIQKLIQKLYNFTNPESPQKVTNLLVIGLQGVGKTDLIRCFLHYFLQKSFMEERLNPDSKEIKATVYSVENEGEKLNMVDTPGFHLSDKTGSLLDEIVEQLAGTGFSN